MAATETLPELISNQNTGVEQGRRDPLRPDGDTGGLAVTRQQRRWAIATFVLLVVIGIVSTPFARMELPAIPGYMTAFGTAMIVINVVLSALLFSKGAILARGDATRLGMAYLFVAAIFLPMVASFPGGIIAGSLIGTAISSVWLWSFWHAGFGLFIIRYAWLAARPERAERLGLSMIVMLIGVIAMTVTATSLLHLLPSTLSDGHTLFSGRSGFIPIVILSILTVAFILVCRLRARTPEQLWLTVAMAAALFDVWLTYWGSNRFSLGWYLSKCGSLFTSLAILITLVHEVTLMHSRAAASNIELGRLAHRLTRARDEAERGNRAKSRFLTGVTHELRTPLHGILGYAELLRLEGELNPTQAGRVTAMIGAGEHLLSMINTVLDLSQIEVDRLELHPLEIELSLFLRASLDVVRPAAEAKGLSLALVAPVPLRLFADPVRLRQSLLNLLGNAIKFTPSGSIEIRLRLAEDGQWIRLEVADTGPGIGAQHRSKLFQTFERLDDDAVNGIEGSGLGLSISARLVELMGGRIGYADNPTGGSIFWVELPARGAVQDAAEPVAACGGDTGPSLRVLVVDDDALNRNIANGFLRIGGHQVVCVESGAAAVEAVATEDFDVVLMDVRMAGMDGLEATRRIRALPGSRGSIRVVAVTAQAFAEQVQIFHEAGMNGHVSKPFTQATLLAALRELAAGPNSRPAELPAVAAVASVPVFSRAVFDDITDLLSTAETDEYLRIMITRCEALLAGLRGSRTHAGDKGLIADAHLLAGSAGTFGFLFVAAAARQFEVDESADAAARLAVAIEEATIIVRQELSAIGQLVQQAW